MPQYCKRVSYDIGASVSVTYGITQHQVVSDVINNQKQSFLLASFEEDVDNQKHFLRGIFASAAL